jgi:hypothetical protein
MPRVGLSCSESVFRVPNETSFRIEASMFLAETSLTIRAISGSGFGRGCWPKQIAVGRRKTNVIRMILSFIETLTLCNKGLVFVLGNAGVGKTIY